MIQILKYLYWEFCDWITVFIFNCPGKIGIKAREYFLRIKCRSSNICIHSLTGNLFLGYENIHFSGSISMGRNCEFSALAGKISFGSRVALNSSIFLGADYGEIKVGNDVLIGPNVVIRAANHCFDLSPEININKQGHAGTSIEIGNDVWIGAHVTILSGATIGDHCIIGAGAVVADHIPSCSIAVGVPAKVIRSITPRTKE